MRAFLPGELAGGNVYTDMACGSHWPWTMYDHMASVLPPIWKGPGKTIGLISSIYTNGETEAQKEKVTNLRPLSEVPTKPEPELRSLQSHPGLLPCGHTWFQDSRTLQGMSAHAGHLRRRRMWAHLYLFPWSPFIWSRSSVIDFSPLEDPQKLQMCEPKRLNWRVSTHALLGNSPKTLENGPGLPGTGKQEWGINSGGAGFPGG